MEARTTSWKIHNIPKQIKRNVLLGLIKGQLNHENFSLSFKDNRRVATLITQEDTLPEIMHKGRALDIRRMNVEVRDVKDIVTPLNKMSYASQLEKKASDVKEMFSHLGCAEVESVASPLEVGYRNKCEFTFGFSSENVPTLGFRPAKFTSAPNLVADPKECTFNTPEEMLSLVQAVNSYLPEKAGLVYNRITNTGFLRLLCLRRLGEHLVCILQANCESFECALDNKMVCDFIDTLPGDVFLSCSTGIFDGLLRDSELRQVKGEKRQYKEVLNGCTFEVFPLGFFQVNKGVAQILVQTLQKSIETDTVLDICCGSGSLGICVAKGTQKKVVGLELSQESVNDAKANAELNGVDAKYFCGSVEKTLPCVLEKTKEPASALIDPPRAGISDKLARGIAQHSNISEIFYISCSYSSVKSNIEAISKTYALKKIYVLDMFPFTKDVECIFHFVRKPETAPAA
ncbi:tRNA (uracil-5-)-methyltransferase [Nematocida major]|uniref:tRNA (uracil-5-)-methyltransferase n=1 Tax=Nematocida major TaxID=1912982 RepID=UPI002008A15D|nr:tRNA (uracil-5-)-methyltransferase [Nematocida major]KAH9386734.1 tRNA (uracil-5-)-methyltransferase [Nematocida major]